MSYIRQYGKYNRKKIISFFVYFILFEIATMAHFDKERSRCYFVVKIKTKEN